MERETFVCSNNSRIEDVRRRKPEFNSSFLSIFDSSFWSFDQRFYYLRHLLYTQVTGMFLARTLHHEKHGATDSAVGTMLSSNHHSTVLRFMQ